MTLSAPRPASARRLASAAATRPGTPATATAPSPGRPASRWARPGEEAGSSRAAKRAPSTAKGEGGGGVAPSPPPPPLSATTRISRHDVHARLAPRVPLDEAGGRGGVRGDENGRHAPRARRGLHRRPRQRRPHGRRAGGAGANEKQRPPRFQRGGQVGAAPLKEGDEARADGRADVDQGAGGQGAQGRVPGGGAVDDELDEAGVQGRGAGARAVRGARERVEGRGRGGEGGAVATAAALITADAHFHLLARHGEGVDPACAGALAAGGRTAGVG